MRTLYYFVSMFQSSAARRVRLVGPRLSMTLNSDSQYNILNVVNDIILEYIVNYIYMDT